MQHKKQFQFGKDNIGLKSIIIFVLVMLLSFGATTIIKQYYADAHFNGGGEDTDPATGRYIGGPTYWRTGWEVYLVDESGVLKSDVVYASTSGAPQGAKIWKARCDGSSTPSRGFTHVPWEPSTPYGPGGEGYGEQIRAYFEANESAKARALVEAYWDEAKWNEVLDKNYKIILEPVYWAHIGGAWFCGNDWGWGTYIKARYGDFAPLWCQRYTNRIYAICCRFNNDEVGLTAMTTPDAGNKYTASAMATRTNALGILLIDPNDVSIHTYWASNGSPGLEEPADPPKDGIYNMVKVYYTKYMVNGSLDYEEQDGSPYVVKNCCSSISVDDEPNEYHLEHWSTDSTLNTSITYSAVRSMNGPQHGNGAKVISLNKTEKNEKTVYVVLVRIKDDVEPEDYNYLMTQSMITRTVWFDYPDVEDGMSLLSDYDFTWKSNGHPATCGGHSHTHYYDHACADSDDEDDEDDYCAGHTSSGSCSGRTWQEKKIKFSLYNYSKDSYPSILATKDGWNDEVKLQEDDEGKRWEPKDSLDRDYRDTYDADTRPTSDEDKNWDYVCVLMRGADKLTLCEAANSGEWIVNDTSAIDDLQDASSEGFSVGNTISGTRKTDDYYESFSNYFDEDGSGDYSTKVKYATRWTCPQCSHTFGICYNTQTYTLSTTLTVNVVVKIETYAGNPNGGWVDTSIDTSDKILKGSSIPGFPSNSMNHHSGRMVNAGNQISFLPYVLMKYQTRSSGYSGYADTLNDQYSGWLKAYVLGQYTRSIDPNDYAEIHWNKTGSPNMDLISNQWSTHALATNCWGTNNVLPGGATLGLKITSGNRQVVYVTTLQCYTDGTGRDQCIKTDGNPGIYERADCEGTHLDFVSSVADALDNTNVQQWQSNNVHDSTAWDNGKKVNRGQSLSGLETSGTRSSDDEKYYFGDIVSGSNKGDYDVNIEGTTTHTYTFYSDVNGNIHMTIDNVSPSQYEDDGAYSAVANAINERTKVRDKLIAAVEQATAGDDTHENSKDCSDDKALNGENWYNEEFDGITVIVQETKITTGFIDPAERTEVLDPKLTETQSSKGGQFGMEYDNKSDQQKTYQLGQFKTRTYSENYGEGNAEVVGMFKGSFVKMHELDFLYWSRKFWIPNLTVQDLY